MNKNHETGRIRVMQTPPRYVQGPDALSMLGEEAARYADRYLILTEEFLYEMKKDMITESFARAGLRYTVTGFGGECCRSEIQRIVEVVKAGRINGLIGFGGGKVLDAGKYAADRCGIPFISVPSLASTDAPCTSVVVIYTESGEVEISTNVAQNPQLVLVDSRMIAEAPVNLFVSGMGDALSTYYEARTAMEQDCDNILGGKITLSAMALARTCRDILLAHGVQAKDDLENGRLTDEVEQVIEADILLSGLGFESGGLSAAHGIHNAFKNRPETHRISHGELVAFGTLCLLAMENRGGGEFEEALKFCAVLGLPITLAELGITEDVEETIRQTAQDTTRQAEKYHMPPNMTEETVCRAILEVDRLGSARRKEKS